MLLNDRVDLYNTQVITKKPIKDCNDDVVTSHSYSHLHLDLCTELEKLENWKPLTQSDHQIKTDIV
jgi:hypothetical protein